MEVTSDQTYSEATLGSMLQRCAAYARVHFPLGRYVTTFRRPKSLLDQYQGKYSQQADFQHFKGKYFRQ